MEGVHSTKRYLTLACPTSCTQPDIHLNTVLHQIGQARLSQDGRYDAASGYARNQTRPYFQHMDGCTPHSQFAHKCFPAAPMSDLRKLLLQ